MALITSISEWTDGCKHSELKTLIQFCINKAKSTPTSLVDAPTVIFVP